VVVAATVVSHRSTALLAVRVAVQVLTGLAAATQAVPVLLIKALRAVRIMPMIQAVAAEERQRLAIPTELHKAVTV
jgi:hypothetical protein